MSDGTLAALGWTDELEAAFTSYAERGFEPARIVAEHRGGYLVRGERDERLANARGRLRDNELWGSMPAVGDWVAVCDAAGGGAAIEAVLPRHSKVSRKTPWLKAEEHILVANVDTVLLVSGLDGDFNPRRIERYLTAAWDSGADPVLVLTKLDVCDDLEKLVEAEAVAIGVPVHAVSNITGEGIEELRALLRPARTFVLLGSSGTGKSTLVNRLAGRRLDADRRPAGATGAGGTRRDIASSSSCRAERCSWTHPACASSRSGRATSTARSPTSPSSRRNAASTTAATRRSLIARCRRLSPVARSIPRATRATASSSASCVRSRSARASGSSGRRSSAGGSGRARAEPRAATGRGRDRYFLICVIQ